MKEDKEDWKDQENKIKNLKEWIGGKNVKVILLY